MSDHPLRPAYEATGYRVGNRFTIRCGERSLPLDALLAESGHDTWPSSRPGIPDRSPWIQPRTAAG